jgi:hypothetical protein
MIDAFFYYSGIVGWVALGSCAILASADAAIDWVVTSLWTKREFMAFVWDRLKKKNGWQDPKIITPKKETAR